jgi:uncharacterized protein with von Willebrand factor type A (vWA) domain
LRFSSLSYSELPEAERELAEASANFEAAKWRRDQAVRRYRRLRDVLSKPLKKR